MRRVLLISLVIFGCVVFVSAQKTNEAINNQIKSLKAEKTLELRYDKPSNFSKVLGYSADFGGDQDRANNLESFNFGITFFFQGSTLDAPPDSFTTTFWAQGKKPQFAESNALTVITAGGENLEVGNARYARKNGDPREFLNFIIPRGVLEKIVKAGEAQLKIGKAAFKFKPEHIKLFSDMLKVSNPAE